MSRRPGFPSAFATERIVFRCASPPGRTLPSGHVSNGGAKIMALQRSGGNPAGISVGGILVIVGVVLGFIWSWPVGIVVALIGLIAFGGFAKGKWY